LSAELSLDSVCAPSEDVVAREIEGEIIIVPLAAGIGDLEDELYTLNETGCAIWRRLDGTRTLRQVAAELSAEYSADSDVLERDVVGLADELTRRRMLSVRVVG
jgi:hypothetical protein